MKFVLQVVLILVFTASAAFAQTVTLTDSQAGKLRQLIERDATARERFAEVKRRADSALADKPKPIQTVTSQGRLQGDPLKTATVAAMRDMPKIYALGAAYRVSGRSEYSKKAADFLLDWARINKPSGDPIDETNFDKAIEGYDMVRPSMAKSDQALVEDWFRRMAQAELSYPRMAPGKGTAINNWNSHRLKIVGEIAWLLNDAKLKQWTLTNLKSQLAVNLNADGTSLDFLERDALHYHTYDLEPLLELAIVLKQNGAGDFYRDKSVKGASIEKSVAFLVPFVTGEKKHGEFVNSKVQFDRDRAKNGEAGYISGTPFQPAEGLNTLSLADYFDERNGKIVRDQTAGKPKFANWQMLINGATR